jgi:amino acid transporter
MRDILTALIVFLCLVVASFVSRAIYERMPERHRVSDTESVVRLLAGFFMVVTSLVIGLLLNTAKNTFEEVDANVHAYATQLILFDRTMRHYGPETDEARRSMLAYAEQAARHMAQADPVLGSRTAESLLRGAGDAVRALVPADDDHAQLKQQLERRFGRIFEMRWALVEQSEGSLPPPLIAMVVLWLIMIFGSYGFRAPHNAVVIISFVVSSVLIAGTVYLILDMDVPFDGLIQVSAEPLERAVAELRLQP